MKRIIYVITISIAIMFMTTLNILAAPHNPNDYTSVNEVSDLLPPNVKQSKVTETPKTRGDFFSGADLIIKNNGNGNVGVLARGYTRHPVDEAYITVYLDKWDETAERWRQIKYFEQEFYAKDYPEGLVTPTIDITFTNQERGYYYRLRGVFAVVYNGEVEAFSPTTDGILID